MNPTLLLFISFIAAFYEKALKAWEDKKLKLAEVAGFIPLGMEVSELIPQADEAWKEIQASNLESVKEVAAHIEKEFHYLKPETRAKITMIFVILLLGVATFKSFVPSQPPAIDAPAEA